MVFSARAQKSVAGISRIAPPALSISASPCARSDRTGSDIVRKINEHNSARRRVRAHCYAWCPLPPPHRTCTSTTPRASRSGFTVRWMICVPYARYLARLALATHIINNRPSIILAVCACARARVKVMFRYVHCSSSSINVRTHWWTDRCTCRRACRRRFRACALRYRVNASLRGRMRRMDSER